jgi:endogenous inhibitor of DNA gyrase (YacG/DUF329 family)
MDLWAREARLYKLEFAAVFVVCGVALSNQLLSASMSTYIWECRLCKAENESTQTECARCGFPAMASTLDEKLWQPEKRCFKPRRPMPALPLGVADLGMRVPCPSCKTHMYWYDEECPHCGHLLSQYEKLASKATYRQNALRGFAIGLVVFPILFVLAWLVT